MTTFIYTKTVRFTNFGKTVIFALTIGVYNYLTKPRCGISDETETGTHAVKPLEGLITSEIIER